MKPRPRGHHYNPTTAPYYIYLITFYSFDIPDSFRRHALVGFPRSAAKSGCGGDRAATLLAADPNARYEKHEARKCSRCGRWCVGLLSGMGDTHSRWLTVHGWWRQFLSYTSRVS